MKNILKKNHSVAIGALASVSLLLTGCETEIKTAGVQSTSSNATTLTDYGSSWDLTTAFPGTGKYSGVSSAIAATDVCSGKNFLGIPGSANCSGAFTSAFASMACRADNATFDPMNPGTRNRSTLANEVAGNLVANGNALIPDPMYDTDGRYAHDDGLPGGVAARKRTYLETVKGRPTKLCGLSGTTDARVSDCDTQNGTKAVWEGSKYGMAGEGDWKLVSLVSTAYCTTADANLSDCENNSQGHWTGTQCAIMARTSTVCTNAGGTWNAAPQGTVAGDSCSGGASMGCFEVWRDERTKIVWSDIHIGLDRVWISTDSQNYRWLSFNSGQSYNWFQAAGYSKNGSTINQSYYEGGTPTATGFAFTQNCNDNTTQTCQPDHPVSVCADATAIAGTNGVASYQNPDGTDVDGIGVPDERPAKGNMTGASHQWRLPTIDDFKLADVNGMRKVLPNMDTCFWSASSFSNGRYNAWNFCGDYGSLNNYYRYYTYYGVLCVGR